MAFLVNKIMVDLKMVEMRKIKTEDCVRVGEDLYFIDADYNIIYQMNIKTGKIVIVGSIPEERLLASRLGSKIVVYHNYLFFAPMSAKKIWRLNLETHEWKGYERKILPTIANNADIFQALVWEDKIFFIGCAYPAIIIFDPISENMEYIEQPYKLLASYAEESKDVFFRTDYEIIDNTLYMASCVANYVLKLNLNTYDFELVEVGSRGNAYSGIEYDGIHFYLSPRKNSPIVVWDGKRESEEIDISKLYDIENTFIFGGVKCRNDKVLFFASFQDYSLEMDRSSIFDSLKICPRKYVFYRSVDDSTTVCLDSFGNMTIENEGETYNYVLDIEIERFFDYLRNRRLRNEFANSIFEETERVGLEFFIATI